MAVVMAGTGGMWRDVEGRCFRGLFVWGRGGGGGDISWDAGGKYKPRWRGTRGRSEKNASWRGGSSYGFDRGFGVMGRNILLEG